MPTRPEVAVEVSIEEQRMQHYAMRQMCPPSNDTAEAAERLATQSPRPMTHASTSVEDVDSKSPESEVDGPPRDTPSPVSLSAEDASENESRSQALANDLAPMTMSDYYAGLYSSAYSRPRYIPNTSSSFLKPGSKFDGTQQSDRQRYDVSVEIKHVDMAESFLCGYLRIRGLTDVHPTLTTYFEGEIVGTKYTFQTKHEEWGSSERVDMAHWNRFPAWKPLSKQAKKPDFSYKNFAQREHIFMRWKEYFLVPDHRVKTITGASFEGFYYICFNQITGHISGIYFHAKSEKYQQLELDVVQDHGCMSAFEFR